VYSERGFGRIARMKCLYINLDSATERRTLLEASFHAAALDGWSLQRIQAVGPAEAESYPGSKPAAVKGCLLSHRRAIQAAIENPGDVLIIEDDTAFSRRGLGLLQQIVARPGQWDLLMTDIGMVSVPEVLRYARAREAFETNRQMTLENLAKVVWVGTSAYVLREASKRKLLELLDVPAIDEPYDLLLRNLIWAGRLTGVFPFPFVTTLGPGATASQIHYDLTLTVASLNAARRLMFVDRDLAQCDAELSALSARTAPQLQRYGAIFAVAVGGGEAVVKP
jgi:GR25 family glycosyltransferase involved in LPS biosynthesis